MKHRMRVIAGVALLATIFVGACGVCQAQDLPPEPIPIEGAEGPKADDVAPPLPPMPIVADPRRAPVDPPAPPSLPRTPIPAEPLPVYPWDPCTTPPPVRTTYDIPDQLLVSPGLFVGFQFGSIGLHINNQLLGQVAVNGFDPDTIRLPIANLDEVSAPRVELGYRMADGLGSFVIAGRFLESNGHVLIANWDIQGDGFLRSRLNVNTLDLDYVSPEHALGEQWDLQWRIGVRLASVYFDSRAEGMFIEEQLSNFFQGAGPHAVLDVRRSLGTGRVSAYGRIEAATLLGSIHQTFEEVLFFGDDSLLSGATSVRGTQAVPVLSLQASLSWVPHGWPHTQFILGYQFEQWWFLGRLGDSRADLTDQGMFLRAEYNY